MATSTLTVPYSIDEPNDLLKLDAVSSLELPHNEKSQCEATVNGSPSDLLIVSPYTSRSHLFDLNSVDKANQLLSTALTVLKAVRPDYATAPYISAFNWSEVLERLKLSLKANAGYQWKEQFFYIVVFRSQIPPSTDRSHLDSLDEAAHAEAMKSGGLLKYWFGEPDENGRNLATCACFKWRGKCVEFSQS